MLIIYDVVHMSGPSLLYIESTDSMIFPSSLAGQPLHKRGKVWCHAYTRGLLLQPGVQPNQIMPRHFKYGGARGTIPNV